MADPSTVYETYLLGVPVVLVAGALARPPEISVIRFRSWLALWAYRVTVAAMIVATFAGFLTAIIGITTDLPLNAITRSLLLIGWSTAVGGVIAELLLRLPLATRDAKQARNATRSDSDQ